MEPHIVMGLLYGEGDMDKTIIISMRCGQDSDCNPSNAAGVLATSLGLGNLPERYKTGIDNDTYFSYTAYNFPKLLDVCEKLARDAIVRCGGRIGKSGKETFVIPCRETILPSMEQSWNPTPISANVDVDFTKEEFKLISDEFKRIGDVVTTWSISEPFVKDLPREELHNVKFDPEVQENYTKWRKLSEEDVEMPDGIVNFLEILKKDDFENSVIYLKTDIWVPQKTPVIIELGSDDAVKLWVNGGMSHQKNEERGVKFGQDAVNVTLNKGWNRVMLKIAQGVGYWRACMNIKSADYKKIEGLKFRN